jgi:hypothetical protein
MASSREPLRISASIVVRPARRAAATRCSHRPAGVHRRIEHGRPEASRPPRRPRNAQPQLGRSSCSRRASVETLTAAPALPAATHPVAGTRADRRAARAGTRLARAPSGGAAGRAAAGSAAPSARRRPSARRGGRVTPGLRTVAAREPAVTVPHDHRSAHRRWDDRRLPPHVEWLGAAPTAPRG